MSALASTTSTSGETAEKSPIDPAALMRIYRRLLECRRIVQKEHAVGRNGANNIEFGPAAIACTVDLNPGDTLAAERWSTEAAIAAGKSGNYVGRTAFTNGSSQELAAFLSMACGLAEGTKAQNRVVVALFSSQLDRRSELILRTAARQKLPVVFVAANSIPPEMLAEGAAAYEPFGFPRVPVDRNDALALYRVGHEAVDRARIGYGPTLIDCLRYELAASGDAVAQFEAHLAGMHLLPHSATASLENSRKLRSQETAAGPEVQLFIPN